MRCFAPDTIGLSQPRTRFPSDSNSLYQKLSNRVKGKKSPGGDFFYPYPLCHSAERRNLVVSFVTTRPRVKSPTKNAMHFSWGPIPRGDGFTNHYPLTLTTCTRRGTPRRGRDGLTPSQGKALAQYRRSHGNAFITRSFNEV